MSERVNIKNIGILAHVDAGKTTLTEQILYKSGIIRELGSVDKGTAHTDNLEVEQQRGISVKASEANLWWKNVEINIIDTPGHVDFSAEVERALSVLDGAILVISAVEGVQPQTEIYFKALKTMKIPTIIFINKIDRVGADVERVLKEIKKLLTESALLLKEDSLIEALAEKDDLLLDKYLGEEEISSELLEERLAILIKECKVYPVISGVAIKGIGVVEILDLIVKFIPSLQDYKEDELSAIVFKVKRNKNL